ncbi:MAG: hypothetical protein ACRDQB_08245, partial [Thermocrispum sp.]
NHVILERDGADHTNYAVDMTGRVASDDLPGQFVAASDKYIVLKHPKDRPSDEYAVYKIQRS